MLHQRGDLGELAKWSLARIGKKKAGSLKKGPFNAPAGKSKGVAGKEDGQQRDLAKEPKRERK